MMKKPKSPGTREQETFTQAEMHERALNIMADASEVEGVEMRVKRNSTRTLVLHQRAEFEDFKDHVETELVPTEDTDMRLLEMESNVRTAYDEMMQRRRAAELRKRRDTLLRDEFTEDELKLMGER